MPQSVSRINLGIIFVPESFTAKGETIKSLIWYPDQVPKLIPQTIIIECSMAINKYSCSLDRPRLCKHVISFLVIFANRNR